MDKHNQRILLQDRPKIGGESWRERTEREKGQLQHSFDALFLYPLKILYVLSA